MATIEQRIYDGNRAKEILDNEVFQQVFDDMEKELFETWKSSPARDGDAREKIYQYQMMLSKLKQRLISTFETGKLAQLEIQHKQNLLQRARDAIFPE